MAKKPNMPKPRDPFALHAAMRKAGAQTKSRKAEKARDRANLKKGVYE